MSIPNIILPQKLINKIVDLEYVEMADLVPESWHLHDEEQGKCCHQAQEMPRKGPVNDICCGQNASSLVVVLGSDIQQQLQI